MSEYGVLVISHGSRDEGWVQLVEEAVNAVQDAEMFPFMRPIWSWWRAD